MALDRSVSAPESGVDPVEDDKSVIYQLRDCVLTITNLTNGKYCCGFRTQSGVIVTLSTIIEKDLSDQELVVSFRNKKGTEVHPLTILGIDWAAGLLTLLCKEQPIALRWDDIYRHSEGSQVICIGSGDIGEGLAKITHISKIRAVDHLGVIPQEVMYLGHEVLPGSVVISKQGILGITIENRLGHALAISEKSMRGVRSFMRLYREPTCEKYPQIVIEKGIWIKKKYCVGVYGRPVKATDRYQDLIGYLITSSTREEVAVGDLVTHLDGKAIGDRVGQSVGSFLLWNEKEIRRVSLTITDRSGGTKKTELNLIPYPEEMDSHHSVKFCL